MGWSWGDGPPPTELERRIAENALAQFDRVVAVVEAAIAATETFPFTPELVQELNELAVRDIEPTAGQYRTRDVTIAGSRHVPPPWQDVPRLVDEMCAYVSVRLTSDWDVKVGIHLAAYVMWRVNWIHPFADGNGRTARAASYLVECVQLRTLLAGDITIPHRIARNRFPYNDALETADAAFRQGRIDVEEMERLLVRLTIDQLKGAP